MHNYFGNYYRNQGEPIESIAPYFENINFQIKFKKREALK